MSECYYRVTHGQTKEIKWKMNSNRNLRINCTQVIVKKEVAGKYDKQLNSQGLFVSWKIKSKFLEVWVGNSVKG